MYLGLEDALAGESPGLVFKNADLLQFAALYKRRPRCLTPRMRDRVNMRVSGVYMNIFSHPIYCVRLLPSLTKSDDQEPLPAVAD